VALELSFLDSNVRLLADELAELNGSVDVYQHRDDDDDDNEDDFDSRRCDPVSADGSMANRRRLRRQRLMPMIAVPLKDTRPIDFGPPLEVILYYNRYTAYPIVCVCVCVCVCFKNEKQYV
jgi:hypothetical protein